MVALRGRDFMQVDKTGYERQDGSVKWPEIRLGGPIQGSALRWV